MKREFIIRDGLAAMDFAAVHALLSGTYWTPGIVRAAVEKAARNSALVIGAFAPDGRQVGFARVISDQCRFAYLCDVVVAEGFRRRGIGRAMVDHALQHPDLAGVRTWTLSTRDAHGVYAPLGFLPVTDSFSRPNDWMVRRQPHSGPAHPPAAAQAPRVLHVVDAFTASPFAGNPAAVCVLSAPAEERWMRLVAREMNLSETAFVHPCEGGFSLRWFTPAVEVKLCGHATLASAHTLWETGVLAPDQPARFSTLSGWLACRKTADGIAMDFPADPVALAEPPRALLEGLAVTPQFVGRAALHWLVEVADEAAVRAATPDFTKLAQVPVQGVILTARAAAPEYDVVSRYFAPASGINEDPVTGSAHCALGPYWQAKLGKADLVACQASARGGVVKVGVRGERVVLGGQAVTVSRVELRA